VEWFEVVVLNREKTGREHKLCDIKLRLCQAGAAASVSAQGQPQRCSLGARLLRAGWSRQWLGLLFVQHLSGGTRATGTSTAPGQPSSYCVAAGANTLSSRCLRSGRSPRGVCRAARWERPRRPVDGAAPGAGGLSPRTVGSAVSRQGKLLLFKESDRVFKKGSFL